MFILTTHCYFWDVNENVFFLSTGEPNDDVFPVSSPLVLKVMLGDCRDIRQCLSLSHAL